MVSPSLNKALELISQQLNFNIKERLKRDLRLFINGKSVNDIKNYRLKQGDELYFIPRIGGG